jgi:hypothetical protein
MSYLSTKIEIKKTKGKLNFANKFLLLAMLVQLFFLLFYQIPVDITIKRKVFSLVAPVSSLCGLIGFLMIYRLLDLKADAIKNSSMQHWVGPNLMSQATIMFWILLLIPGWNLFAIIWAYAKSKSSIRKLDDLSVELARKEKIRKNLTSYH